MQSKILVDAPGGADLLDCSERQFHMLRKRPDWPADCEVVLGPRARRYRVVVLERYAAELAAKSVAQNEPAQLKRARQTRREIPSA
jgi:hypothetical protein